MNPFYKKSVLAFGLVAPLLLIVVLFGVALHYKSDLEIAYEQRRSGYTKFKQTQQVREGLEQTVKSQEQLMDKWMGLFETATASRVNGILSEVQKRFPGEEFQQTSFRRSHSKSGIGGASKQPSVQLDLKFRGTYRGLQNAFLELETHMPHLQLDTMKIKQEPNRNVLSADLAYTAWQKE